MGKGCSGVKDGETREGTGLVGVEEVTGPGKEGEAEGSDSFCYFGEGF